MATLLQHAQFHNRVRCVFLFGSVLALAAILSPQRALANNLTICKQTIPSAGTSGTFFNFTGANSWATPPKSFQPPSFQLQDSTSDPTKCRTFNLTGRDQFNKITETAPPPGWTLTNISCSNVTKSAVQIIGANPNPAFQPGDNTVTIDQADPNVTCTFVNTCTVKKILSTGVAQWLVTRPNGVSGSAYPVVPNSNWANLTPPFAGGGPFPPGTSWVQPANSPATTVNEVGGQYIYQLRFSIPCPARVEGWFAADNAATLQIDNSPPFVCLGNPSGFCFLQANVTGFTQPVAAGGHVIRIRVINQSLTPTGLLAYIIVQ